MCVCACVWYISASCIILNAYSTAMLCYTLCVYIYIYVYEREGGRKKGRGGGKRERDLRDHALPHAV